MRTLPLGLVAVAWTFSVAWTGQALGEETIKNETLSREVAPLLKRHCIRCHGADEQEGDVTLHDLPIAMTSRDKASRWQAALRKMVLGEMPPEDEPRPDAGELRQAIARISDELLKNGHASDLERLRDDPAMGNYVDHEALFSGKHQGPSWSPSRLWRISPYISNGKYADRKQLGRHLNGASQPFNVADEPNIKDYAGMWRIDGPTLELLLLNADQLVVNQLGPAPSELAAMDEAYLQRVMNDPKLDEKKRKAMLRKKPSGNAMRWAEKDFHAIAYGDQPPSKEQRELMIARQFQTALRRDPTAEETARYSQLTAECVEEAGNLEGLRAVLTAILLMPETVYRMELGLGKETADGRRRLSPMELAFALSYA
ncbi:MAG: hypothetical protein N2C14_33020, partial [Planctomycetales bacterium]